MQTFPTYSVAIGTKWRAIPSTVTGYAFAMMDKVTEVPGVVLKRCLFSHLALMRPGVQILDTEQPCITSSDTSRRQFDCNHYGAWAKMHSDSETWSHPFHVNVTQTQTQFTQVLAGIVCLYRNPLAARVRCWLHPPETTIEPELCVTQAPA